MGKRALDITEWPNLVIAQRVAMSLLGLAIQGDNFVPGKSIPIAIEKAKRIERRNVPENLHPAFPDAQTLKRAWKGKTRIQPQSIQAIQFWLATPANFESLLRIDCVTSRAWSDDDYLSPLVRALHCMSYMTSRKRESADQEKDESIADVCGFVLGRFEPDKQCQVTLPGFHLAGLSKFNRKAYKRDRSPDQSARTLKSVLLNHEVPVSFRCDPVFLDWYRASNGNDPRCLLRCLLQVSLDPKIDLHLSPALLRWTIDLATAMLCVQAKLLSEDRSHYGAAEFGYARAITTLAHLLWDGDDFANDFAIARMLDRLHLEPSEANGQRINKCINTLMAGAALFRSFCTMLGINRYLLWTAWNKAREVHTTSGSLTIGEPQRARLSAITTRCVKKLPLNSAHQLRRQAVESFRYYERQSAEAFRHNPGKFVSDRNALKRERKAFYLLKHTAEIRYSKNAGTPQEVFAWLQSELENQCPSILAGVRHSFDFGQAELELTVKPRHSRDQATRSNSPSADAGTASPAASTHDRLTRRSPSHPGPGPTVSESSTV